ncbi:hypothetical protein ERO13_D13G236366v2 [Gossypium hirsutum]|nr:hypothetical protein ERO13_D13G236366v2 [Gossypium hirsutum]
MGLWSPTSLQDRTRDSDEDDIHDRDYDVAALANNLSQAFRYKIYGNDDNEEDRGALDRDDEDVNFDDESAEVVISSLRLGDDQGSSLFTNSNWFAFQDEGTSSAPMAISPTEVMHEINLNGTTNSNNSSSDDEVVVGEDDEMNENGTSTSNPMNGFNNSVSSGELNLQENENLFGGRPSPSGLQVVGSSKNPFLDDDNPDVNPPSPIDTVMTDGESLLNGESILPNGSSDSMDSSEGSMSSDTSQKSPPLVPSLFEEDVEFVGVELEGTEKPMEQALKEGIVGEARPLKRNGSGGIPILEKEKSDESTGIKEFNDSNYWRVDHEVTVLE